MLLDIARPMVIPSPREVASIADEVPRFIAGTDAIIRLLFGDSKRPLPIPIMARVSTRYKMLEFALILLRRRSDSPISKNPAEVRMREPILSEKRPATGDTIIIAM